MEPRHAVELMDTVSRSGSNVGLGNLFASPMFGASYGFSLFGRSVTVALGLFAPPAVGKSEYSAPNYAREDPMNPMSRYVQNPRRAAPNRYMLVSQDILITYPTLSVAYDLHRIVQVGLSLQLVTSQFDFSQAIYSGLSEPMRSVDEDPSFDSMVKASLRGQVGFTGILGLMVRPTESLSFGASVRPPIPIRASGTLSFALGEQARNLSTQVTGDRGELTFTMPLELRVGARFSPSPTWGVNADFVYQGWDSLTALNLTPMDVSLSFGSGEPQPVGAFKVPKNWVASFSGRLGGSVRPWKWTSLSAGVWYETSAIPSAYFALDFPHPSRLFVTGGVTGHLGPIDVIAGVAWTPTSTLDVFDSNQRQQQTQQSVMGGVVGNGQYVTGGWILSLGVRGNFQLGEAPKAAPAPVDAPAAAPQPN
jgi:long-subunit fatty acid transport protein